MQFDLFFSLAQTPRGDGPLPSHAQLLNEFLEQATLADELGYGCLWVAESHFSSEMQKRHRHPVIVDWRGEIGLNTDICQLAAQVFARTRRIEVGSAIMNIIGAGGPLCAAERVATALAWHGLRPQERRRMQIGFGAGRFDFIARTTGVVPRSAWEEAAWPIVKRLHFAEAAEIFVRLLNGEALSSDDVKQQTVEAHMFHTPEAFAAVAALAGVSGPGIPLPRRWPFELTKVVPDFPRELLQLTVGTHDLALQAHLNRYAPVRVFNLSITPEAVIRATHEHMARCYHAQGGEWKRSHMPRTVLVFVNADRGLTTEMRRRAATERARAALAAYWRGLEGTVDEAKIASSCDNALIGAPEDVAAQIARRFDQDDTLLLWFDLAAEDSESVLTGMQVFVDEVVPQLANRGVPVRRARIGAVGRA